MPAGAQAGQGVAGGVPDAVQSPAVLLRIDGPIILQWVAETKEELELMREERMKEIYDFLDN